MKKILYFLTIITMLFIPNTIKALTYNVESADATISFDYEWYVFTRENIENNDELNDLDISYEDMYDFLYNNKAYVVAYYDYLELFMRNNKIEGESMYNLTNYDDSTLNELGIELSERIGFTDYEIYKNNYNFIRSNYYDKDSNKYIIEYYTVINAKVYTITVQKEDEFTKSEKYTIEKIVDSIKFNIDQNYEKEPINDITIKPIISKIIIGCIIGGCIGAAIGGIVGIVNKIRKNKTK